jgi:hypothetical protein
MESSQTGQIGFPYASSRFFKGRPPSPKECSKRKARRPRLPERFADPSGRLDQAVLDVLAGAPDVGGIAEAVEAAVAELRAGQADAVRSASPRVTRWPFLFSFSLTSPHCPNSAP